MTAGGDSRGERPPQAEGRRLRLPGPLDLAASLEGFRRWGDDLVDRWDGHRFLRGAPTPVAIDVAGPATVVIHGPGAGDVSCMVVQEPIAALAAIDPVVARVDARHPGVRPILELDPLTAIIRSISAQQVNLAWACTTRRRLVEHFGRSATVAGSEVWSYDVDRLASADPATIRALQFTTMKARFIVAAARLAADGGLDRRSFAPLDDDGVVARLTTLPGVGRWTADWFLARTLGRPVVAAGDLAVRKAVGLAYCEGRMPTEQEVRDRTAHWGESAGVAQQLLLHALIEGTLPELVRA